MKFLASLSLLVLSLSSCGLVDNGYKPCVCPENTGLGLDSVEPELESVRIYGHLAISGISNWQTLKLGVNLLDDSGNVIFSLFDRTLPADREYVDFCGSGDLKSNSQARSSCDCSTESSFNLTEQKADSSELREPSIRSFEHTYSYSDDYFRLEIVLGSKLEKFQLFIDDDESLDFSSEDRVSQAVAVTSSEALILSFAAQKKKTVFSGFDINGDQASCQAIEPETACTEVFTPGDAFAQSCIEQDGEVFQCGCHEFLCSKSIEEVPFVPTVVD